MWKRLPVTIERRVRQPEGASEPGVKRAPSGYDIADRRKVEIGDSPRSVSLRHLAKFGELEVVEKFPDRRGVVLLLVDLSLSGELGTVRSKRQTVADIVYGLGIGCLARGLVLRCLAFTDRIELETPSFGGHSRLDDTVHELRTMETKGVRTDPGPALARAWEMTRAGRPADMVCIVSDFLFPQPYRRQLESLSDAADVVAVAVRDPMEESAPPVAGAFRFRDAETGDIMYSSGIVNEDPSAYLERIGIGRCVLYTNEEDHEHYRRLDDFFTARRDARKGANS